MGNYFLNRIERLRDTIALRSTECFFTSKSEDVFYLTGFKSTNANLFITKNKVKILTDKRYTQQLKSIHNFIEVDFIETKFDEAFQKIIKDLKVKKIFLEHSKISLAKYFELRKAKGLYWSGLKDELNYFFAFQDEDAIQKTKKAIKLTEKIFTEILDEIKEGITEVDLQAELIYRLAKIPDGKISFEPIVLFGKNSAYPHGIPSKTKLKKNSVVLIDFGLSYQGFTSDFTRTLFFGKPSDEFKKIYSIVKDALHIAIDNLNVDVKANSVYESVINHFKKFGVEKFFTHGLGHGLGIYLHNFPHLSKNSMDLIKSNLVIAIEPALYFEKKFGIRIEQDVLITNSEKEILTKFSDELIVL